MKRRTCLRRMEEEGLKNRAPSRPVFYLFPRARVRVCVCGWPATAAARFAQETVYFLRS